MSSRKKVSIKTIAEAANVSPSTVSLVLNNRGKELRIAPETQKRIHKIAEEFGYFNSPSNTQYCINKYEPASLNPIIVFVTNDFQNIPFAKFNAGLEEYAKHSSDQVDWVYHTYETNHLCDYQMLLSSSYYKGAIISTPSLDDARFLMENHFHIPIILYNYQINGYTCICYDNYNIGRQAADVFLKLRKEKLSIIVPDNTNRGINLRIAGFTGHLSESGFLNENICIASGPSKDTYGGYIAASKLLEQSFIPSAIYIVNDLMTGGVINRLKEENLRIPDDVSILSYGDIDASKSIPSVSSYIAESEKIAYTCLEQLMMEIKGLAVPGRYISFGTECIWRESCCQPE